MTSFLSPFRLSLLWLIFTTASYGLAADDYQVQFRIVSVPQTALTYLLPPSTNPLDVTALVEKVERMLSSRQAEMVATCKTRCTPNSRATIEEDSRIEFEISGSAENGINMNIAINPLRSSPEMRLVTQVPVVPGKPQLLGISQPTAPAQKDRVILMLVELK